MDNNLNRTLSPLEAKLVLQLEWEERPLISRTEIMRSLNGSTQRADRVIRSLLAKNWLERLSSGRYLFVPASRGPQGIPDSNMLAIGRHFVDPYYFAYTTAAAHYRFTSQSRTTVWIATTKHAPDRTIRGTRFRFISMVKRKFFGYESTEVFNEKVNLSDPEKTVIDCVDRPDLAGGIGEVTRIIARAARALNWGNLSKHALQFNSVATVQRLGYLAGRARVEIPNDCLQQLRSLLRKNSRSFLAFPGRWGRTGHYDPEWQVIVNVSDSEILSEM